MKNYKAYKAIEIICHILGFPLLLAVLVGVSIPTFKGGIGYGIPVFAGVIVTLVIALIYYIVFIVSAKKEKKRREVLKQRIESADRNGSVRPSTADPARRTGIVLAIVSVICLTGLWVLIDLALPNPIQTATSNTVLYEDLSDNWQARGDVHVELLDEFITKSFNAGNLKQKSLDEYLKEGIKNKEVKQLIADEFESIDKNGYATFIGPSIDLAQNRRMTIPALVHLLLDEREPVSDSNGNRLDSKIPLATFALRYIGGEDSDLQIGSNYQYIRSNQQYQLYTGTFEKVGKMYDKAIIFDSNVGVIRLQFLSGKNGEVSYVYEIKHSGEDKVSCYQYTLDKVTASSIIEKNGSGYKYTLVESGDTNTTDYADLNEALSDNAEFDFLANVDFSALTVNNFIGDEAIVPAGWNAGVIVLEKTTELAYADWDVLDMLGTAMGFNVPIDMIKDINITFSGMTITGDKILTSFVPTINDALATVSALASSKEILGSDLTIGFNTETGELSLVPCNESRGTLDYMRVAWLQNNGLLYVLVGLFSTRKVFLIFGAVIAMLSYVIGVMREMYARGKEEAQPEEETTVIAEEEVVEDDVISDDMHEIDIDVSDPVLTINIDETESE